MLQSNKPIMEKRRRARINNCLNELKTLILDAMKKDVSVPSFERLTLVTIHKLCIALPLAGVAEEMRLTRYCCCCCSRRGIPSWRRPTSWR